MLADPHFKPDELSPALSFFFFYILFYNFDTQKRKPDLPMWLHPKKELNVRGVHGDVMTNMLERMALLHTC